MKIFFIHSLLALIFSAGMLIFNFSSLFSKSTEDSDWFMYGLKAYEAQDYVQAMKSFQKADLQADGNAFAEYYIGALHAFGLGVPQNYHEAMKWYLKSAQTGYPIAESEIGSLYANGLGVPQDYQEAMKWYRKADAPGVLSDGRIFKKGVMYQSGPGDPEVKTKIGYLYEKGLGVSQDYQEAVKWYRKAAALGNVVAENNIGNLYIEGHGVPRDYQKAMEWLLKAASQGDTPAETNIGALYTDGRGVHQDYREAMKWFQKAAKKENAKAEYNIGAFYNNGQGVSKDYQKAMKWYEKALKHGFAPAQKSIDDLKQKMIK